MAEAVSQLTSAGHVGGSVAALSVHPRRRSMAGVIPGRVYYVYGIVVDRVLRQKRSNNNGFNILEEAEKFAA